MCFSAATYVAARAMTAKILYNMLMIERFVGGVVEAVGYRPLSADVRYLYPLT